MGGRPLNEVLDTVPICSAYRGMFFLALAVLLSACVRHEPPSWQSLGVDRLVLTWGEFGRRSDGVLAERISLCDGGVAILDRTNRRSLTVGRLLSWKIVGNELQLRDRNELLDSLRLISTSTIRGLGTAVVTNIRGEVLTYVRPKNVSQCR
jgi:hypothetical protein